LGGGAAETFGLTLATSFVAGEAGLRGLGGESFLAVLTGFWAGPFFAAGLADAAGLGADLLTAGLDLERAAGAAGLALFAGDGRAALRRSFAMFVLLWRSRHAWRRKP
jgi:hypothetical protein